MSNSKLCHFPAPRVLITVMLVSLGSLSSQHTAGGSRVSVLIGSFELFKGIYTKHYYLYIQTLWVSCHDCAHRS